MLNKYHYHIILSTKDSEAEAFRKEKKLHEMQRPNSKQPASQIKSTTQVFKGNKYKIVKVTKFYLSLFMII